MTTITNNKLPEWRTALDKCVENYQSTRAWYEENRDSPAALDDMERAEDQLANFVKKYGFSIVLSLLDEIDDLQELRRSCLALRGEIEDVQAQLYEAENRNNADDDELQERRKADSAEPLAWTDEEELRDLRAVGFCEMFSVEPISKDADIRRVIPLYRHAQPTPVVPDYASFEEFWSSFEHPFAEDDELKSFAVEIWNACRAVMLQSKYRDLSQPVDPQISEYEKIMEQAGNSPVIPDGYALVPVEPTDEMIVAAMDSDDVTYNESDDTVFYVHHCEIYKAMLAAAPQPETNNK